LEKEQDRAAEAREAAADAEAADAEEADVAGWAATERAPVPEEAANARTAGRESLTLPECPATRSNAPSAGHPWSGSESRSGGKRGAQCLSDKKTQAPPTADSKSGINKKVEEVILMPLRDGTGPPRQGEGRRQGRRGGRGRMGVNLPGFGAGGYCVCPDCGLKMLHKAGIPCSEQSCPECGAKMVREP